MPSYSFKALEKLKRQLAEAEAALEARKKPPEDTGPKIIGEGLVIDEWVSYLRKVRICAVQYFSLREKILISQFLFVLFLFSVFLVSQKERRERYLARQQVEGLDSV